jgi:uncharacterized DUF497 family protein
VAYEWHAGKAAANLRKHGISFREASSVFLDPNALSYEDPDHSEDELRAITLGLSSHQRLVFVSHCWRKDRVRIIMARKATPREIKQYVERLSSAR